MLNVFCYFPGGAHSLTRRWMEHQPSQKELLLTLLAVGILSSAAGYYYENAYLIIGSISWVISYGLLNERPSDSQALSTTNNFSFSVNNDPTPLRLMRFIALSAFLGNCIRKSWIPSNTPNPNWMPYLLKAPFHFISFMQVLKSAQGEISDPMGKIITRFVRQTPNEKQVLISAIAILALSSTVTFLAPRLNLISGFVACLAMIPIGSDIISRESKIEDMLKLVSTAIKLAMLITIGGFMGHVIRSLIGPRNYSPAYSYPAKIGFASTLIPCHILSILLLIVTHLVKGRERNVLQWINQTFPALDTQVSAELEAYEKVIDTIQGYASLSLSEMQNKISTWDNMHSSTIQTFEQLAALKNRNELPANLRGTYIELSHKVALLYLEKAFLHIVFILSTIKHQSIASSIEEIKAPAKGFRELYNRTTGKIVPPYAAKTLNAKDPDRETVISNFKLRFDVMPSTSWTKAQAAYVLLAKYDKDDPDNIENREMQKNNYKTLALLIHPDKQDKEKEKYDETFKALSKAKTALGF